MSKFDEKDGKFLKDIIEPMAAKIYKDDLKLPVNNSSKLLGLTGSKGKDSPLNTQYEKYEEAMNKLENL